MDMKKCKYCQEDINKNAKRCPKCQGDLRSWFAKHPLLTGVLILFVIGVFGASTGDQKVSTSQPEAQKVATSQETPQANPEVISTSTPKPVTETPDEIFKVGDIIRMRDWEIIVNDVKKTKSKGYSTATTGKEYVIVNITMKNIGTEEQKGVGGGDYKVQDSNGVRDSSTYISLDDRMETYVDLIPEGKLTGSIPFEVPVGDTGLTLVFQPNYWIDSQRIVVQLQ